MAGGKKDLPPGKQAASDAAHVLDHTVREKALHQGVHHAGKIASNVGKTIAQVAPKAVPAMVKAAPSIAQVAVPTLAKVVTPLLGGVPGAVVSAFSGNTGRGFNEMQKTRADMLTPEKSTKRAMAYRNTPKLMMNKKMVAVKSPAYSGQSTMGKAMMASAKKKV